MKSSFDLSVGVPIVRNQLALDDSNVTLQQLFCGTIGFKDFTPSVDQQRRGTAYFECF
ncbi:hypothetical protein IVB25_07855 [Bradyrhizobium sp. 193]|uniref:hypothetical protein n=1 Tax=Bradyrhizobium sp. 193 TaxID=2782661 RepID=UPI001FF9A72A|nr:hypothetical protein [Bradyrhizobium sp. 193]MCK1482645.1 hypothetical protein [Bradyrhizobium sp. 193]